MGNLLLLTGREYFAECVDASCEQAIVRGSRGSLGVVVDTSHPKCPIKWQKPGLGDRVAAALDSVGITKDRVQAVASAVGINDCGCAERQAAMNSWGSKHLGMPPGSTAAD